MAEVRYYADEHVPRAVVDGLRRRGVDVLTVPEAGTLGDPDEAHLALALRQGRVVFTQDADFLRLAAAGEPHAGLVYAPQGVAVGELVRGLVLVARVLDAGEMVGHIEYL